MPLPSPPVLDALPVTLRLIQRAATGTTVLGATMATQAPLGINGVRGYQSGNFEPALSEQGSMTVTLPNAAGADGKLHRNRFDCLTDATYNQGDEWIEVWHGTAGRGRLLFVGTPTDWRVSRTTIALTLADGTGPLELQRETAAGFWHHAPRDVFEHYSKAWRVILADDFDAGADAAKWSSSGTNQTGSVRLSTAGQGIAVLGTTQAGVTLASERIWRLEATYSNLILTGVGVVSLALATSDSSLVQVDVGATFVEITIDDGTTPDVVDVAATYAPATRDLTVAIEGRDRFILFYVGGQLAHVVEYDMATAALVYRPDVSTTSGAGVDLENILFRRADPYLIRGVAKGDYRLPGTLPSGGLRGTYYDEADLRPLGQSNAALRRMLAPTRQPYARRQDATINFASANPPVFQPAGPASGQWFSARWTGAIFLDLATTDIFLKVTGLQYNVRLWVGKTMYGEQAVDHWHVIAPSGFTGFTPALRTHLGTSVAGWYPIRIEWVQFTGSGGIQLSASTTGLGGVYTTVPTTSLSPYGIYESDVRYDSHSEQLKAIVSTFGYQYRCEPKSLESGGFPGELLPKVRVGRDTDKVLTPSESTEVELTGSAQDTVQTLLADAAGLADPSNAVQLTNESVNYGAAFPPAVADRHMMTATGYESLSDITDPALLATRLAAMLGLRLTPWEEIGAKPRGPRELRDTFPLTGVMALFAWEPGDGVRIVDEQLGFADTACRQIIAPSWPFVPDGLLAPSIRFRQRPRSQQDALRDLVRAVLLPQRNYQGQLSVIQGTASSSASGDYIDIGLPANLDDVVSCNLIVAFKTDSSTWSVKNLAGTTLATFNTSGRVDLTPYVARRTDGFGATSQSMVVQLVGGTLAAAGRLELTVRI